MNKSIIKIVVVITIMLSFIACNAQIKNAITETVKIYGNCGMCKKTIENAGNSKEIAKIDWNVDTKIATLTYDGKKTNKDAVLKRIALSGYDSDTFLAPDSAYSKLPTCCQYDRVAKVAVETKSKTEIILENQGKHANHLETTTVKIQKENQLKAVFDTYFEVKNALVKTDGQTVSAKATALLLAISAVKMDKLTAGEHAIWMNVLKNLNADAAYIAATKDVKNQRDHFDTLSNNIYELIKVSNQETPIYYQFCPMANDGKGANWLSKENAVKNPYYGAMMLSCGKTVEIIN